MNQNHNIINLFFLIQLINLFILKGNNWEMFMKKKSRLIFVFLPSMIALSLLWRPL